MAHLPQLIVDLALILCAAAITTLVFKKLNQPVVLGYIIAGMLVGPNFSLFPTITDTASISVWAEIGIIVLLFNLGLEFSFKKVVKVGSTAAVTGIFEMSLMMAIGFFTGKALGWSQMDCLFLGGIISISSTTIIIRAFDELGVKTRKFAGMVLGVLIIEDIVAVLLLVLLSTLAVSQQFEGSELLFSILKLVFFLTLWFLGGIFLVPTLFKKVKKLLSDETLLIISLGLCLLMVILATQAGFSAALGAFIMGSILAETTQAEKIEHILKPVKDLFGAIFFVSVGMLINPVLLWENAPAVLILTAAVMLGKSINVTLGMLISGQPLKTAVQSGMSLSQIGEFSFIIATLGLSLKVTSEFLYPIAVGVSVITTFTTPYMIRYSENAYQFLDKILPERWKHIINRYSSSTQKISTENDWQKVIKEYISVIAINAVIILGISQLSGYVLLPFLRANTPNNIIANLIYFTATFLVCLPFFWALFRKKMRGDAFTKLWLNKNFNRGPLLTLELLRLAVSILLVVIIISPFVSTTYALVFTVVSMTLVTRVFSKNIQNFYSRIENRFFSNFNEREIAANAKLEATKDLMPWDAHFAYFELSEASQCVGKPLEALQLREKYGINLALIERGKIKIYVPSKDQILFPGDRLTVTGTDQQLIDVKPILEAEIKDQEQNSHDNIVLDQIHVRPGDAFCKKSIRDSGIREKTHGLVVGIERDNERFLNPESGFEMIAGDIIWVVGDKKKIKSLSKENT